MTVSELEKVVFQLVLAVQRLTGEKFELPKEWRDVIDKWNNQPSCCGLHGVTGIMGAGVGKNAAFDVSDKNCKKDVFNSLNQQAGQETKNYGGASDYSLKDYLSDTDNNTAFITEALPQILESLKNGDIGMIANIASLLQYTEKYRDFFLVWYAGDDDIKQTLRLFFLLHSGIVLPESIENKLFSGLTDNQQKWLKDSLLEISRLQESEKNKADIQQSRPAL